MMPVRLPLRYLHEDMYVWVASMQAPSAHERDPAVLASETLPTECGHLSHQRVRIISYAKGIDLACH